MKDSKVSNILKLVYYSQGNVLLSFELNQTKLLVGSGENCDVKIADPSVSHYHAMIFVDHNGDGAEIVDLKSANGILINKNLATRSYFTEGDVIAIGGLVFAVELSSEIRGTGDQVLHNHDENVSVLHPSLERPLSVGLRPKEGMVVIDEEYCDITFDEQGFSPDNSLQLDHPTIVKDYIGFDREDEESIEIQRKLKSHSLEVITTSRHNIISIDYLPINKKTYHASNRTGRSDTICFDFLETSEKRIPFIRNVQGNLIVYEIGQFKLLESKGSDEKEVVKSFPLTDKEVAILFNKTIQIFVRKVVTPPQLKIAPFFGRDYHSKKKIAQVFAGLMSLTMLLLFFDTNNVAIEETKKISVVYRQAEVAEKKLVKSEDPENNNSNPGENVVEDSPVVEKMEEAPTKVPAKEVAKQEVKVEKPTPPRPMEVAETAPVKVEAPKMKAYKFEMKDSFKSLVNNRIDSSSVAVNQDRSLASSNLNVQNSDAAVLGKRSNDSAVRSTGATGKALAQSLGGKGRISKEGIDTSFVGPKTVVLGSMDPELLRKILREYLPQFRHCYQQELLKKDSNVKGVISLDFRIDPNGKVSSTNIRAQRAKFSDSGVKCMAQVLNMIQFPSPKGGGHVDVTQPLNFQSERESVY